MLQEPVGTTIQIQILAWADFGGEIYIFFTSSIPDTPDTYK